MSRELVVIAAFASLIALVTSTSVIFWRNGQRQPSWAEWKSGFKAGRPLYLVAAASALVLSVLLLVMRLSPAAA